MEEQNNKSDAAYKTAIRRIISQNSAKHLAASAIFAAKRKIFTSRRLGRVAIAGITESAFYDTYLENTGLLDDLAINAYDETHPSILFFAIKRAFDAVIGLIGCIGLVLILPFIKIAYLLTGDTAPLILKQERLGQNGKKFTFYKIRTMVTGKNGSLEAANLLEDLFREHPELREEYAKTKKLKNDPRITKVGKFLRKTSLDEFAQFINVLKGDIAVIGNRPYLPAEEEDMGFFKDDVLSTKGGLVSYWAVNGRNDLDFHERLRLEQYYSKNQSLSLDLKIFFGAFKTVLGSKGAQ